jgi:hypothetical protein
MFINSRFSDAWNGEISMNGLLRMPHRHTCRDQNGLNVVDIMIWLTIASMLISIAFQALQPYREASIIYQMKSDLRGVAEISGANGTYTGIVQDSEVEAAVAKSQKSKGITISWGKFALYAETPPEETPAPEAIAGTPMMELVSSVTSSVPAALPGKSINTYVLVARHPEVPSMRVVYFFDDVHEYKRGAEVISITELPPIQDMFGITPDPSDIPPVVSSPTSDPTEPSGTPTEEPTSTVPPVATETPTVAPSEDVTPTEEATASPTPTPTPTTPEPSPLPTQDESPSPSPSPAPTEKPEDPTPEPNPLTPGDNLNPKTKKFLFCHNGMMHSNSYTGMINGHEHHAEDIMPPIPPLNYPGWNWTYRNAQTFYNNCIPVTP